MKKIVASVLMASFIIASTGLQAQRGGRGGNGGGGSRSFGGGNGGGRSNSAADMTRPSRSFGTGNESRSFGRQPSRSLSQPQRSIDQPQRSFSQPQRNLNTPFNSGRDMVAQPRNFGPQRNPAIQNVGPNRVYNNNRIINSNRNVVVQNNFYGGGRGGYFAPHYRPIGSYYYHPAPRLVVSIGGPYRTIPWLGIPYNYYGGYWYRPYGASFQIIAPPIGIRIGTLPFGYSPVFGPWGDYYYYNNVFYRHPVTDATQYEVVDAPLGAQVPELPKGAEVRVINSQKYYELDGTFYKEDLKDGQIWYTVVGKKGVLSTYDENYNAAPLNDLSNGDRVSFLPDGTKTITINGQLLYVAPNGLYYQQVQDGDKTWYEVVGQ